MNSTTLLFFRLLSGPRQRAVSAWISALILLLQRSPVAKLLLEVRDFAPTGFAEVLKWAVTSVAGLGAYNTVAGASTVTQLSPSPNTTTVNTINGNSLVFLFQYGGSDTPDHFRVTGTIPTGLTQTHSTNSKTDSITGVPTVSGSFPITIRAWRNAAETSDSVSANFTIVVANLPAPAISGHPTGGSYLPGDLASLSVTQTNGQMFVWKKGTVALPTAETVLFGKTSLRKYFVPSTTVDPGTSWRSGAAFTDTAWTSVSGGVGFDTNTTLDYNPQIAAGGNVQALMSGAGLPTSLYLRMPFNLSASGKALSYLKLRVQYDDGFAAFLNGIAIAGGSRNAPATLAFNSAASAGSTDSIAYTEIDISSSLGLLRKGENLLAVQLLNQSNTSSDLLFNCELAGGINATNSSKLVLTSVTASDAGSYTVDVVNPTSSATSNAAVITVAGIAPTIGTHPVPASINSGATATLSVSASGDATLAYQWYEGASGVVTTPVSGAVSASFTTPPLSVTKSYWVRVTNLSGFANSNAATVTVLEPFVSWEAGFFTAPELANPLVSGVSADPDGDGIPNLLEFVLGRQPRSWDGGSALRPVPETPVGGGAQQLVFRVPHAASLGNIGVRFQSATSPAATVWTDVVNGVGGAVVTNVVNQFEVRLPLSSSALFVRMVATQP